MENIKKKPTKRHVIGAVLSLVFLLCMALSTSVIASAAVWDAWLPGGGSENSFTSGFGGVTRPNTNNGGGLTHTGYVADISKHNGDVDFYAMKNSGIEGVMMRAAYGMKEDIRFEQNSAAAQSAGMPYGVYHFVTWHYGTDYNTAMSKADEQARYLLTLLQGKRVRGYVALDLELESGCTLAMNKDELTSVANYYMGIIESAGYRPILYCSISWLQNKMNASAVHYPLWIAYYNDTGSFEFPQTNYGNSMRNMSGSIYLWQYSSKGDGPSHGVASTYLDMNRSYHSFTN